ncbi:DUF4241 domain-containing protein [Kitasatospora sp. NPDC004240]
MSGRVAVEARYGVDWDVSSGVLVHPLTETGARERDAAGEPFVVELREAGGRVRTVVRSCATRGVVHVLVVGAAGAVDREYQYLDLWPDLLHLRSFRDFRPPGADAAEPFTPPWFEADIAPDGEARIDANTADGGLFQTRADVPAPYRTLARAPFGRWDTYLEQPASIITADADAAPDDDARDRAVRRPAWAELPGLRPRHLRTLFTAGARLEFDDGRTAEVREPESAGILRLPTGRVIAGDPGWIGAEHEPFTVTVPAGDHPLLIAQMNWVKDEEGEDDEWGDEDKWGDWGDENTAAKLVILPDRPTVGWEPALRPGQDPQTLGPNSFYGFDVDTATGCFLDAAVRDALAKAYNPLRGLPGSTDGSNSSYPSWTDPDTGGTVITYVTGMGDGSYPVWIGRDSEGQVTCLVADMLLLHGARPVPPTVEDPTPYRVPLPHHPAEAPPCGPFPAAADHLARLRTDITATAESVRASLKPWE